ncbi:phosphopantetheinyl transferase, partial [Kouleothrix aurantiaca]
MIDWLLQSSAAHPAIAQGIAPEGLLSPAEAARLATMPVAKRRRDWL